MLEGWAMQTASECRDAFETELPLIAEFHPETDDRVPSVMLFEDGTIDIEGDGSVPVDLLPYVVAEWHNWMRKRAP
jgi:hypothetical protein